MPTKSRNRRSPKSLARRMKPTRSSLSRKKGSARARNPKKMRGGVTRKRLSQLTEQELFTALEELPADVVLKIGKRHPLLIPPFTNATLPRAVQDYLAGGPCAARPRSSSAPRATPCSAPSCVEINQCVGCTRKFFTKSFPGDDTAVLAPSDGDESTLPRHRAGVASNAP